MLCPECNHTLSPISLKSRTFEDMTYLARQVRSDDVVLDYCTHCGGIWSDAGEINFVHLEDMAPLINLLPQNPAPTNANYQLLACPKDKNILRFFKRESIPDFLTLLRCSTCGGIWFPNTTLVSFKKAQEAKINYFKTWQIPLQSVFAILLPVLVFALLGTGIYLTTVSVNTSTEVRTRAKDLLSYPVVRTPKAGEALISFTTLTPSKTKLVYWITPNQKNEIWVSENVSTTHMIHLTNLQKGAQYSYQIIITQPKLITSEVYTFQVH